MKTVLVDFLELLNFSRDEMKRLRDQASSIERYYSIKIRATEDGNKIAMYEAKMKQALLRIQARQNALFAPGIAWVYNVIKFTPKAYRMEPIHIPHIHIRLSEEESKLFDKSVEKAGYTIVPKALVKMRVYFDEEKTKVVKYKIDDYKEVD